MCFIGYVKGSVIGYGVCITKNNNLYTSFYISNKTHVYFLLFPYKRVYILGGSAKIAAQCILGACEVEEFLVLNLFYLPIL